MTTQEKTPLIFAPGIRTSYYVDNSNHRGSYNRVLFTFGEVGFETHFFQPDWDRADPQLWASEMAHYASEVAKQREHKQVVLAGFSCGALTAALAAAQLESQSAKAEVAGLLACSMSPWFGRERVWRSLLVSDSELHELPDTLKDNLSNISLPKVNVPAQLYVGLQEIDTVHSIHQAALELWPDAESIKPPCSHNIFHDSYLQALSQNAGRLALAA